MQDEATNVRRDFELLTGTTPIPKDRLQDLAYSQFRQVVREYQPVYPSQQIGNMEDGIDIIAKSRAITPRRLRRKLVGDLDAIVMKAIEKDRNWRYQTAQELADDLARYLAGKEILIKPKTLSRCFQDSSYEKYGRLDNCFLGWSGPWCDCNVLLLGCHARLWMGGSGSLTLTRLRVKS